MAAMAVGPTGESLHEPKMAYIKQAIKEEYSPYRGGNPATFE
jgi:hypothetical protein